MVKYNPLRVIKPTAQAPSDRGVASGERRACPESEGTCAWGGGAVLGALERTAHCPSLIDEGTATFRYAEVALLNLSGACAWTPERGGLCGGEANATVVATYQALDAQLDTYLCAPPYASWLTFAKYSARQVGSWIRGLEGTWSLIHALRPGRSSLPEKLRAGRRLARLMLEGSLASTAVRTVLGAAGRAVRALGERRAPKSGAKSSWLGMLAAAPRRFLAMLRAVRGALVEGNTELYGRIARAFNMFLGAESRGESGLGALEAAVRSGSIEDSFGYLRRGFSQYRLARMIGLALSAPCTSDGIRASLEALRRKLIFNANLMIAVQEQALILQKSTVFGNPIVYELLADVGPGELSLPLAAARGRQAENFTMLPEGGNWADFATRMGFRHVEDKEPGGADVFTVALPEAPNEAKRYAPDWSRRGTIVDLFTLYFEGPRGARLRRGAPAAGLEARAKSAPPSSPMSGAPAGMHRARDAGCVDIAA